MAVKKYINKNEETLYKKYEQTEIPEEENKEEIKDNVKPEKENKSSKKRSTGRKIKRLETKAISFSKDFLEYNENENTDVKKIQNLAKNIVPNSDKEGIKVAADAAGGTYGLPSTGGIPTTFNMASPGDVFTSMYGKMYSPPFTPDSFQIPNDEKSLIALYRYYYNTDPLVGRIIDLHTMLPISKVTLTIPESEHKDFALESYEFYASLMTKLDLNKIIKQLTMDWYLIGKSEMFVEDALSKLNNAILNNLDFNELNIDSIEDEIISSVKDALSKEKIYFKEEDDYVPIKNIIGDPNYKGPKRITFLPPEKVRHLKISFTDLDQYYLKIDPEMIMIISAIADAQANNNDEKLQMLKQSIGTELFESLAKRDFKLTDDGYVKLNSNIYKDSYIVEFANKMSEYDLVPISPIRRVLKLLMIRDKIISAINTTTNRNMYPKRIVTGTDIGDDELSNLAAQVDMATSDPDYAIVANYPIEWNEVGTQDRVMDFSSYLDMTEKQIIIGLGLTEGLLTGESLFSAERLTIETLNNAYMNYRHNLSTLIEEKIFKPIAIKKGFIEVDKNYNIKYLYPQVKFTRLSIRDTSETFESLMALYQKGSLPIDVLYEIFGIDMTSATIHSLEDLFTIRGPLFNKIVESIYDQAGSKINEKYGEQIASLIAENMNLIKKEEINEIKNLISKDLEELKDFDIEEKKPEEKVEKKKEEKTTESKEVKKEQSNNNAKKENA